MTNYNNSVIYSIYCNDPSIEDIYIGSTTNIQRRRLQHKHNCCNPNSREYNIPVYKFIRDHGGWEKWSVIELEDSNLETKLDLHKLEKKWMVDFKPTLNIQTPTRNTKEYYIDNISRIKENVKQYYIKNLDKIKEYKQRYYIKNKEKYKIKNDNYRLNNKDKISEYKKQYSINNKEKLKKKRSQLITCSCGCIISIQNKPRHLKSQKHFNHLNNLH